MSSAGDPSAAQPHSEAQSEDRGPPERWLALSFPAPADPDLREMVIALVMEGECTPEPPRGVEEHDGNVRFYLPPPEGGVHPLVVGLQNALRSVGAEDAAQGVRPSWQAHEAWAELWRKGFSTRRITPRIQVTPSWLPLPTPPGEVVVTVDPGMAFGTSEHPTTRGCLALLDPRVSEGDRVADVGAGSGILAIACALLGASDVLALELDPWAAASARDNVALNGVQAQVRVETRGVGPAFLPHVSPLDGIVANMESPILKPLLPGFHGGLLPGGWLILSGILVAEKDEMDALTRGLGFLPTGSVQEEDWVALAYRKPGVGGESVGPVGV